MSHKLSLLQIIVVLTLLFNTNSALVKAAPQQSITGTQSGVVTPIRETLPPPNSPEAPEDAWVVSAYIASCQDMMTNRIFLPLAAQNVSGAQSAAQSRNATAPQLPLAPQDAAPPLDRSVSYDIYEATRFLYTGSNPIQTGVTPDAISRRCVAVLRGNVITRDRQPLPGVSISIQDHPEFGQTLSRADGLFNLALNGGGTIIVEYQKEGYLPVQRRIVTQRRQFKIVEPVALIQPDTQATVIDPNSTADFQIARGSVVSDRSGSRQATLLFPKGALTSLVSAQGALRSAAQLTIRATEYTVGAAGAAAMPGNLPPGSGYTYAIEFSVDEASGQGNLTFDKPIINYTENMITAPVGSAVPAGYYDRDKGEWIPSKNGRVIKILSLTGDMADLDITGDGVADTGPALADLGVTDQERQQLAGLYGAGQELWRVEVPHFSPWDFNWPFGPPPGAQEPPAPDDPGNQPNACSESGSVIDCDAQSLGESLAVPGTPFTLNYVTRRTPGWKTGNYLDVPITVGEPPTTVKTISLYAEVGGRLIVKRWSRYGMGHSFGISGMYTGTIEAIAPNINYRLTWDGQDGYDRAANGRPVAHVELKYVYDYTYYTARDEFEQSFGQFGEDLFITSGREYCAYLDYPPAAEVAFYFCGINLTRSYSRPLGYWDAVAAGLGGWTLDVHHAYDPNDGALHLGDGADLLNGDIGPVVATIVDDPQINYMGDFAIAPDGAVFFYDWFERHIARIEPGGPLEIYAGNGTQGMPTGDGGPATAATLGWAVNAVEIGPDGSLYLAGTHNNFNTGFIRRVTPDGVIHTIAGAFYTETNGLNGDGGPATAARLNNPEDILFGPDGSLYIAETPQYRLAGGNYNRIRKITNGIITTVAGAGSDADPNADLAGIPALDWGALPAPGPMAFGPDGSLYVTHPGNNTVSRIAPDGMLRRFAGNGGAGNSGDGGMALTANLGEPQSVAVDPNGVVFVRTRPQNSDRIRRISPEGTITAYAGRDCFRPQNNHGLSARQACISGFGDRLEIAPDGALVFNSTRSNIERIGSPVPSEGALGQTLLIPAPGGAAVYEFSSVGRHLRTLSALTGATLYRFGYDAAGRLTSVSDFDGNTTHIERAADGKPTAIVAPGGQRTTLALNAGGYLSAVANPAGETTSMTYKAGGLLETLTDARGGVHQFTYDADGRLIRDENPAGGVKTLARLETPGRTVVTVTTGMGRTTLYATETVSNGDRLRSVTAPDGSTRTLTIGEGSVWTLTNPDGSVERVTYSPDPRWGMNAPLAASVVITTPANVQWQMDAARTVTLASENNPFSLVSQQDEMNVNGQIWRYTYTANDRSFSLQSPEGRLTVLTLDAAGRIINSNLDSSGALAAVGQTYDSRGRLTTITQGSRLTQFAYNNANLVTGMTEPDGKITTMAYDAIGRITSATLPGDRVIAFTYDANSNLAGLTPPGRTAHTFTYAADNQLAEYTPPTVSGGGNSQWVYDADRNMTGYTRPDSNMTLAYLNDGYQLGSVTLARGARSQTFDAAGRLQTVTDPSGVGLSYTYDGPLLIERNQSGPAAGVVGLTYTNWLVSSVTVNNANPIAYQYDDDSLVVGAGALTIDRHANHGLVLGSQLVNVNDVWTYNAYAEATGYLAQFNSSPLFQTALTRDGNGRITGKTETIGGVSTPYSYTYDAAGRLAEVRQNNSVIGSYSYDANGNRLNANDISAAYDAQDRLAQAGAAQFSYTGAGYLAGKTAGGAITTYQYDEAGNLMGATLPNSTQLAYLVDGLNRRVGKRVNGVLLQGFLYQNGFRPIAELDGGSTVVSRFVYGARSNVPEYLIKGGQTYRIISDHLGSPRLVVNVADGQVAQRLDYDAWGKVTQDTNPGFQPFGFAGGLYDRDTGLVRFGLRDYDPDNGRWTSKDPIGFYAGDGNLYAYVHNDPVNFIDPTGLAEDASPSPCPPEDDSPHSLGDRFGEFMNKYVGRPLRAVKDAFSDAVDWVADKVIEKIDWIRETWREIKSPHARDGAELIKKGVDVVNDNIPLPVTPSEAVKETVDRGVDAVDGNNEKGRTLRNLLRDSQD